MKTKMTLLIDGDCLALIYRYGFGDQSKLHEYMPNDDGTYFDNEGYDSSTFKDKDDAIKVLEMRHPNLAIKIV